MINRLTALWQINFTGEFETKKSKKKISKVKCINSEQIISVLLIFYMFDSILYSSQSPSQ